MACRVRKLFGQGYKFDSVVRLMGGLDLYLKDLKTDEDYDLLSMETRQLLEDMIFKTRDAAMANFAQEEQIDENQTADDNAYY